MSVFRLGVFAVLMLFSLSAARADGLLRGVTVGNTISEADVNKLGEWNVGLVRFPISCGVAADAFTEEEYNAWLETALNQFDALLPAFEANKIKVVLLLYSPAGGHKSHEKAEHRLFTEAWAQANFRTTWIKIATRYKDNSTIWGYDVLNEPAERTIGSGLKNWNQLSRDISILIKTIDPTKKIILETVFGNPFKVTKLKVLKIPGVIYSVHMYFPLDFIHQGLYGHTKRIAYPTKKFKKANLVRFAEGVKAFQKKNKVQIYIGEFSSVRWAPGNSSYNYMRDMISIFEKNKWHWTYHAFREADPWSVEIGSNPNDLTPSPTPTNREILLRNAFQKNTLNR